MEDFDEWMSADFNNDAAGRKGLINSKDILIDDFGDDELREAVATMGLKTDRKHTINDEGSDDDEMEDDDDHDEITEIDISEEFEDLSNGAGFITYSVSVPELARDSKLFHQLSHHSVDFT